MPAKLIQSAAPLTAGALEQASHALLVLPFAKTLDGLGTVPGLDRLRAALKRRSMKAEELAKTPLGVNLPQGGLASFVMLDRGKSVFERQSVLRRALAPLMDEQPQEVVLALFGSAEVRRENAREALYVAWVNGMRLPSRKKKPAQKPLARLRLHGARDAEGFAEIAAVAEANFLARELTVLPPNELTPSAYRQRLRRMARARRWGFEEYDMRRLRRLGAGAFVAVAQGSRPEDAAIVHLS